MYRCINLTYEISRGMCKLNVYDMFRTAPRTFGSNAWTKMRKFLKREEFNAEIWEDFKKNYNKNYASKEEESMRKQVFLETYRYVARNERLRGNFSRKVEVNGLADHTFEEIKARCGRRNPAPCSDYPSNASWLDFLKKLDNLH